MPVVLAILAILAVLLTVAIADERLLQQNYSTIMTYSSLDD